MKNRLIPCVLACLMIFLVGCNGNTAKEAAQEITKTETSFPAGNTETNSQEDTAEEPESTAVQEETPITAEECKSTAESQTVTTVQTKPAEEKTRLFLKACTYKYIRTCPNRNWHASFWHILPMTALKFLDLRQQARKILPCPRQNLLKNPRTILMWTGS